MLLLCEQQHACVLDNIDSVSTFRLFHISDPTGLAIQNAGRTQKVGIF